MSYANEGGDRIRRWEALLFLTVSISFMIFVLLSLHQMEEVRLQREIHKQIEEENEKIKGENEELINLLLNRVDMYEAVTSNAITTMPITKPSGLTPQIIENVFDKMAPGLRGTEEHYILAEEKYEINCVIVIAICIIESNGGTSKIAIEKNNLAGLGAYDGLAYISAITFDSRADSIYYLAELLSRRPEGGLCGVNQWYASDKMWASKVADVACAIVRIGINGDMVNYVNKKYRGVCIDALDRAGISLCDNTYNC